MAKTQKQRVREKAMFISLLVAVLMLFGKFIAFFLSGSTAILSDALESVVHIFATLFSTLSVRFAARPADETHLYGHGKIVILSIGIEGALVTVAAIYIAIEAISVLIAGPELHELGVALVLTALFAFINLGLGLYLVRTGQENNAPVLVANGKHVLTDMWTSIAVFCGVFIVWLTGIYWLDPIVALAAASYICYTGIVIVKEALQEMMDEANPSDTKTLVNLLDTIKSEGLIHEYHQLRHRRVNGVLSVEFHILFPGDDTVESAHQETTVIEQRLKATFGEETRVLTHIEPLDHSDAHPKEFEEEDPLAEVDISSK